MYAATRSLPTRPRSSTMRALLLLALLLVPLPALAQEGPQITPGKRVRIASSVFEGVGHVSAVDDQALTVLVENQAVPLTVPHASVQRVEVRRQNTTGEGALKGFRWGATFGAGLWVLSLALIDYDLQDPDSPESTSRTEAAVGFPLVYGSIGAVWGALRPGGRWVRASVPARVAVGPVSGGGMAVGMGVSF